MPWNTPTLSQVRSLVRDAIRGKLPGADATIPNSVLRVLSDNQGALCHLTLQYVDWLALQLLPDTAENIWLDRHANIWLVNSDGTTGRKLATLAQGSVTMTGIGGTIVPVATQMGSATTAYETLAQITIDEGTPTPVDVRALDPGSAGNLLPGAVLTLITGVSGVDSTAAVVDMGGGTDDETDDELRTRILLRIQAPPMGGEQKDYVQWALAVPGCTRAWCFPSEMGMGTVTVRPMFDDLRADIGGFPLQEDLDAVTTYLDTVRPVAVKDFFVEAPIPYPINLRITWLDPDTAAVRAAITSSLLNEFFLRSMPGQTWYRAWSDAGILAAEGLNAYHLTADDVVMPSSGYMPTLGDIRYG